jgi:hypothetical protein
VTFEQRCEGGEGTSHSGYLEESVLGTGDSNRQTRRWNHAWYPCGWSRMSKEETWPLPCQVRPGEYFKDFDL